MPYDQVPSKFKAGTLHSGGPMGPVVKNRSQMLAIMLSEKRKSATNPEYGPLAKALSKKKSKGIF